MARRYGPDNEVCMGQGDDTLLFHDLRSQLLQLRHTSHYHGPSRPMHKDHASKCEFSITCPKLHDQGIDLLKQCIRVTYTSLGNHGAGGGGLVLPVRGENTDGTVVPSQTVDPRLDQNEAELGVLVLAVALEVLADGNGLNDQSVFRLRSMVGTAARWISPS
jgi:hypothetical protein